jgi:hypothetical protein
MRTGIEFRRGRPRCRRVVPRITEWVKRAQQSSEGNSVPVMLKEFIAKLEGWGLNFSYCRAATASLILATPFSMFSIEVAKESLR